MKRTLALLSLLLLTLAACGGDDPASTSARGGSPTPSGATTAPTPTATDQVEESPDDATATPTAAPEEGSSEAAGEDGDADGGERDGQEPRSEQQSVGEGGVNPPKTGDYVYDLEGTTTNPFTAGDRQYPDDTTATVEVSKDGDIYSSRTTNSEDQGSNTSRVRWEPNRALLLFTKQEQGPVTLSCTFEPPVEILHIPVKAETFPTQQWSSDNCEGTTDITVVGQEDVQDANGKTWSTWKIEQETDYTFRGQQGTATGTLRSTTWLSPDLGNGVKSHDRNDGEFKNQTGTGQEFHSDTTTTLRSHP